MNRIPLRSDTRLFVAQMDEAGVRHNNAFRREHGLQGRHDLRGMERLTGVA